MKPESTKVKGIPYDFGGRVLIIPPLSLGAMERLLSVLREALPDDRPRFGEPGFSGLSEYWRHADKVQALADRVAAGELGDEDRMLLESLPHDALGCLDMTAPELVTMLARVEAMC